MVSSYLHSNTEATSTDRRGSSPPPPIVTTSSSTKDEQQQLQQQQEHRQQQQQQSPKITQVSSQQRLSFSKNNNFYGKPRSLTEYENIFTNTISNKNNLWLFLHHCQCEFSIENMIGFIEFYQFIKLFNDYYFTSDNTHLQLLLHLQTDNELTIIENKIKHLLIKYQLYENIKLSEINQCLHFTKIDNQIQCSFVCLVCLLCNFQACFSVLCIHVLFLQKG